MYEVRQDLARAALANPVAELGRCLDTAGLPTFFRGRRVGVTAGSRRIDGLVPLLAHLVSRLRSAGLEPFLVPAMGSHGGATAGGQLSVLERNGITETSVGAPIEPSMDTVLLGTTPGGAQVFYARAALEADGIVAINRVGLHTGYSGDTQSGVMKMLAVGLGKAEGARAIHSHGFGAAHLPGEAARMVIEEGPPVLGIGLVEDGEKKLARVQVMPGESILEREPELLREAAGYWPRLPVARADLLIVEEIGKDISGTGMDPHVTGRGKRAREGEATFSAGRVVALRLTGASGGNATGIGLADIITLDLADAIDADVTCSNVLTSGAMDRIRMPVVARTDREAVEMALAAAEHPGDARVVHIKNTRQLAKMHVSEPLVDEVRAAGARIVGEVSLSFDSDGRLEGIGTL